VWRYGCETSQGAQSSQRGEYPAEADECRFELGQRDAEKYSDKPACRQESSKAFCVESKSRVLGGGV